jgi:phage-related holin
MKEWLYKGLLVLAATLAPIKPLLISCGVLIVADTITGIMAARKRGEKINSADMRRSISKMVVYQIAIISAFVLEAHMLDGLLPVSKVVGGVIGMVEFKSILENASAIAGQDLVQLVIDKLGSKNAKGLK